MTRSAFAFILLVFVVVAFVTYTFFDIRRQTEQTWCSGKNRGDEGEILSRKVIKDNDGGRTVRVVIRHYMSFETYGLYDSTDHELETTSALKEDSLILTARFPDSHIPYFRVRARGENIDQLLDN